MTTVTPLQRPPWPPVNREALAAAIRVGAEKRYAKALGNGEARRARILLHACEQAARGNLEFVRQLENLRMIPVTFDEFLDSREFMGERINVWPQLREDLRIINADVWVGEDPVHEAFLGGGTNVGKTVIMTLTTLYQIYQMCCMRVPQKHWNLAPATQLLIPLQSKTRAVTERNLYKPMRLDFEGMEFNKRHVRWNREKSSVLEIEGGIEVVPAIASLDAYIGAATPGGDIDEINFFSRVEGSKRSTDGGTYDQAQEVYSNLSRRRRNRFTTRGYGLGCLVVASSTKYKGDFLDARIDRIIADKERNTFWSRHSSYDVAPPGKFCGDKFRLLVGTDDYPTKILRDDDRLPLGADVKQVPVEFLPDFRHDPERALRDIVGVATLALEPFITRRDAIPQAMDRGRDMGLRSWVVLKREEEIVDLERDGLPEVDVSGLPSAADRAKPHYAHIDLSSTGDLCGVAFSRFDGHVVVEQAPGVLDRLPSIVVPFSISIKPSKVRPIDYGELRAWITRFASQHGINLVAVTLDGYQSTDSIQLFRKAGIRSWRQSVDLTMEPYELLRRCLYQGRIALPARECLRLELVQLEHNKVKGKVDHTVKSTKDESDAVTGAVWLASQSADAKRGSAALTAADGPAVDLRVERPRPSGRDRPSRRRPGSRKQDPMPEVSELPPEPTPALPEGYGAPRPMRFPARKS